MIADTSAWVEFLRATGSRCDLRLRKALPADQIIWLPAVVLQELLQGARDPVQFARLEAQPGRSATAPGRPTGRPWNVGWRKT